MELSPGTRLGAYEILNAIGAGGMGQVYRARDTKLNRYVAIKVLPPHLASHPDALARFEREAQAVAALSHPNILAIHDFGVHDTTAYAVMELLEGETLRQRLSGPEDPSRQAPPALTLVLFGQTLGRPARGYVQDLAGGPPRAFTPEGVGVVKWWKVLVSKDGSRVIARDSSGRLAIYRLDGGDPEPVTTIRRDDFPLGWGDDRREIVVARGYARPWFVERLDLQSGRRQPIMEVRARDLAGLRLSLLAVAADGRHYVHSYSRLLTDLYLVEGLR